MKRLSLLFLALTLSAAGLFAAEKIVAGPNGGRLLNSEPHKAEFFVTKDRKVEVTFYDAALKPVPPGAHVVTIIAEPKSGRTAVDLEKNGTGYLSKSALPDSSEPYRVVVQVRANAEAKPQNFRLDLNTATCGECQRAEYACTCAGH